MASLVVFGPSQHGAYHELRGSGKDALGPPVPSKLITFLREWATSGTAGIVVLTGNAGTGKTAAADEFCRELGGRLPDTDSLVPVGTALVSKDLSGLPDRKARADAFRTAFAARRDQQVLACVNEGILRDAAEDLIAELPSLGDQLDVALTLGAYVGDDIRIINLNRQRWTSPATWQQLIDYVTQVADSQGCEGCPRATVRVPGADGVAVGECPMAVNASALRSAEVSEAVRMTLRIAAGNEVLTLREILALLAYCLMGGAPNNELLWSCDVVKDSWRDRAQVAFWAESAYFNLFWGDGLSSEVRARSPLFRALAPLQVGEVSDVEADDWLRDPEAASGRVVALAGGPAVQHDPLRPPSPLAESRSLLDRVSSERGVMTFATLGERQAQSEDAEEVAACNEALVAGPSAALISWRRRLFFEAGEELGGLECAFRRLVALSDAPDLLTLARKVADGEPVASEIAGLISGLNQLVLGFPFASEGLLVAEPASLFARDPGAFRRPRPAFIHASIPSSSVLLRSPDGADVATFLDVDHLEVDFVVSLGGVKDPVLRLTPGVFQAIRSADVSRSPSSQGSAVLADIRSFFGELAEAYSSGAGGLRVADPKRGALLTVVLPQGKAQGAP